jgi:hypothetical protein
MKPLTTILSGTALAAALIFGAPTNMSAKSTTSTAKAEKHKKHKKSKKTTGSASRTMTHPNSNTLK